MTGDEQGVAASDGISVDFGNAGYLMVCLCEPTGKEVGCGEFFPLGELCKTHDNAIKLASMQGYSVALFVQNAKGDYVPVADEMVKGDG